jgi:hypothetical protein
LNGTVRPFEAVEIMRLFERRLTIDPALALQLFEIAPAGLPQRPVDDLARRQVESFMRHTEPLRQSADHLVIAAAFAGRIDELRPEQDVLAAAGLIDVVVLHEHGRGQDDVRHRGGLGHELLVRAHEQVIARETALHHILVGRN